MSGPVFAAYSCEWPLSNPAPQNHLSSSPLGFSSSEDPVITAAHGASPAGS